VEGYSRLMSMDERATVAALDAARRVFRRAQIYAGQIDRPKPFNDVPRLVKYCMSRSARPVT